MDINYIVRTHREGTINTDASIEETLNKMGQDALTTRTLGSVVAIVEKVAGRITKNKLRWGEDNDPKFQGIMERNADALLAQTLKLVEGGGDDDDIRVKFVAKK